jgi:hypothetical protein
MRESALKNLLWVLLELATAIIFGWITTYVIDGNAAFVSGILVFMCIEFVRSNVGMKALEQKVDALLELVPKFEARDGFTEIRLLYYKRGTGQVSEHAIEVDKHQMLQLWRECMVRATVSWQALQYARSDETWGLGWGAKDGYFIQEERIKSGCRIERIIVLDDDAERKKWERIAEAQKRIGIQLGWVHKRELIANKLVNSKIGFLRTLDIAIWDSRWAYLIYTDEGRDAKVAKVTDDLDIVEACQSVINEAKILNSQLSEPQGSSMAPEVDASK